MIIFTNETKFTCISQQHIIKRKGSCQKSKRSSTLDVTNLEQNRKSHVMNVQQLKTLFSFLCSRVNVAFGAVFDEKLAGGLNFSTVGAHPKLESYVYSI